MAEENQQQVTTKEPQQVQQVTKELQRVTTKDPKKVEAGKRLAAINHKKREEQTQLEKTEGGVNQYYGIGAVIALGVISCLGYYIYHTKKGEQSSNPQQNNPKPRPQALAIYLQTNKFEMD